MQSGREEDGIPDFLAPRQRRAAHPRAARSPGWALGSSARKERLEAVRSQPRCDPEMAKPRARDPDPHQCHQLTGAGSPNGVLLCAAGWGV